MRFSRSASTASAAKTLEDSPSFPYTIGMREVLAYTQDTVSLKDLTPAPNITDLGTLVNIILRNAFTIAGILALILLIFGGFGFIISAGSGDAKGMEKGKQAITGALIGLILIVLSASIVSLVGIITGQKLLGQ